MCNIAGIINLFTDQIKLEIIIKVADRKNPRTEICGGIQFSKDRKYLYTLH